MDNTRAELFPAHRALLGLAILTLILSLLAIRAPVDDAFITYRYAERIAAGAGFTFNDGSPVEGFTSMIWTLLLAASVRLGLPVVESSVGLGLATIAGTFTALWWTLGTLRVRPGVRLVVLLLFSISTLFFKVALLGLEFGLFAVLLTVFVTLMLRISRAESRAPIAAGMLAGLVAAALFLTRPDTVLYLPTLFAVIVTAAVIGDRLRKDSVLAAAVAMTAFLVLFSLITCFRQLYFGQWMPQSVSAKSPLPWSDLSRESLSLQLRWVQEGIDYLLAAYWRSPALLVMLAGAIWLLYRGKRRLDTTIVALPILLHHGLMVVFGGDWMPFDRFVTVFIPLYLLLFALALEELGAVGSSPRIRVVALTVGVLYAASNLALSPLRWPPSLDKPVTGDRLYSAIGKVLAPAWERSDILLPEAIGQIGFAMPEATLLDPAGLVSPEIAGQKDAYRSVYGRSHWPFAISHQPAVIVIHSLFSNRKGKALMAVGRFDYSPFCLPPLLDATDRRWTIILLRRDRRNHYLPALEPLRPVRVSFPPVPPHDLDLSAVCKGIG